MRNQLRVAIGLLCTLLVAGVIAQAANTLTVGPAGSGATYTSIQVAIDAAGVNDTIQVFTGTYSESVTVNKTLTIVGAAGCKLQGPGTGNGFLIKAPNVSIQGFEVKGYAIGVRTYGGPSSYGSLVLRDMNLNANTQNGVLIVYDTFSSVTVDGCTIANNTQNGVGIANGATIGTLNILDTQISGNKYNGIYIAGAGTTISGGLVQDTLFVSNTEQGVHIENGAVVSQLAVRGGTFQANKAAIATKTSTVTDLEIIGASILSNKLAGIIIGGTVNGLLVEGCTFLGNSNEHLDLGLTWGGYTLSLQNAVIRGNTFGDGPWHSVHIAGAAFAVGDLVVTENIFVKSGSFGVNNTTLNLVLAYNNWWGSALGPNIYWSSVTYASASVAFGPWLGTHPSETNWTFIVDDRGPIGPAGYLQPALDAAHDGDTVLVKAGAYVTQGVVGASVRIVGEPSATIKSPGSQTYTIEESTGVFDPIVFAYGGTIAGTHVSGPAVSHTDVTGFVIDGQNAAAAGNVRFVGILYRNVEGEISGNVIQNMLRPGGVGSGAQTFGILVYGDSVVDVLNNDVSSFSRGGIVIMGDGGAAPDPVGNVMLNVVTGNGLESATGWWAENGIQIGYGAGGAVVGNTVTDCVVNNPYWASTGIMLIEAAPGVLVALNHVARNDIGIAVDTTSGARIIGNTVVDSTFDGIRLGWPADNAYVFQNVASGNLYGITVYDASGNVIEQNDLVGNTYGLALDGDSHDNLVQGNRLHGNTAFAVVVAPYYAEPTGTTLRFNSIVGNTFGVDNTAVETVDAALNWWGSVGGPMHGDNPDGAGDAVSDNVIYSPWLGLDPDGNPLTPGVQIADPLYIIVAPVGPAPAGGYLNMAIDGSNTVPGVGAHTIEVRHGTYDASKPITNPASIVSEPGSAAHTFLTGDMAAASSYVVLGRLGQGFTVLGSITVPPGTDASTILANWNNLLGLVVNAGDGALEATLNYWGDPDGPAAGEVTGLVAYSPWLGLPADDTPMVLVVAPVGAQPAGGYLNTAIAAANTLPGADTIEVKHGTYDASTPITSPVNIRSEPGSASHTTLTSAMSVKSGGVLIGGPLQGFRILGDVTVEELVNAASSKINWSDLYGTVANKGIGTFDAKYNFWGTQEYAVIDARTIGDIAVDPYLPKNADDSYDDVVVLINAGMVGSVDGAIQQLWAMDQLGQDVDTFIDYQGVAGAGAFQSLPPGSQITVGGAGGGGGLETTIAGTYAVGDIIDGRFVLTDPITGLPVEDALVTVSLLGPAGSALAFWGVTTYDESTGEYVFQIDTSGLAPGSYEMIIQTADGQTETLTIEIEEP